MANLGAVCCCIRFLVKALAPASVGIRAIEAPVVCCPKYILKCIRIIARSPLID